MLGAGIGARAGMCEPPDQRGRIQAAITLPYAEP
jgi:hypothetical protein